MGFDFNYDYDIDPKGQFYLGDILTEHHYIQMFCGKYVSFLNKGATGNGGTTGFVRYALANGTGCLILVPNRSIVQSKEREYKGNPNVCCVYGGSEQVDPSAQVVISTYDQFPVLKKTLCPGGFIQTDNIWDNKFWHDRTIIVDEYHKIVDESGFRDICFDLTELVKDTKDGCVFMSATPSYEYIELMRKIIDDREVVTYNVKYDKSIYINTYEVKQKDLRDIIHKVTVNSQQTCVFLNNVGMIQKIGQHMECDYEILCSNNNNRTLGHHYSEEFHKDKKLHFMTSAYFTGHDINEKVSQCIIIGSSESENMCLSMKDIRQIIGRFRKKMPLVHIFWVKKSKDKDRYCPVYDEWKYKKKYLDAVGDGWTEDKDGREIKLSYIRLDDTIQRFEYWESLDTITKKLNECEFDFEATKMKVPPFGEIEKKKQISLKQAKERIANGEKVTYEEYKHCYQIQEYMKTYGTTKMKNATRQQILNWYKIRQNVGETDINICSPDEKLKAVGLKDFGRYTGSYLRDTLSFLGVNGDWDELSMNMFEIFGVYTGVINEKENQRQSSYIWMMIKPDDFCEDNNFGSNLLNKSITPENVISTEISQKLHIMKNISLKVVTPDPKHHYAVKIDINESNKYYSEMEKIKLWEWVNQDKENRLPGIKKSKDWQNIKKFNQTMISEMFRDTDKVYRFGRQPMEYIDHFIIDIDNGLSFSEFKKRYSQWEWTAYPTLNNITEDWTKFRVIVPLAQRVKLKGEYNLMTLKILRRIFCYFEDNNHQLFSYINKNDWDNRITNKGMKYNIPQSVADKIYEGIKSSKDFTHLKFDESQITPITIDVKTLDWGKSYFEKSFDGPDGSRHRALYVIKNRLSTEDRQLFEDWLLKNHHHYMDKWKSHKIKTSF